ADRLVDTAYRATPAPAGPGRRAQPQPLPPRPIHTSVDASGEYLLTAYNAPSNVTVHRIGRDGKIGDQVAQPAKPDAGIYAHQIRTMPGNRTAILVARGDQAPHGQPEDP